MDEFKDLVDKHLNNAKPLSTGLGLYKKKSITPSLHKERLQPVVPPQTKKKPDFEELQMLHKTVEELQQKAVALEKHAFSKPWLGQAMDLLVVWVVFLVFPILTLVVLPMPSPGLMLMPQVVGLFFCFYLFLLAAYLWTFHFFHSPTLGMRYQNIYAWPVGWRWNEKKFFPALKRAVGTLTLDALWRKI